MGATYAFTYLYIDPNSGEKPKVWKCVRGTLISASGATLNGTVNANGSSTTVTFEYGTDTSYGTTVAADQSPGTGSTDTAVSATLSGLLPSTTYHFRVVGQNASGTTLGANTTFATLVLGEVPVLGLEGTAVLIGLLALIGFLAIRLGCHVSH
jgi:hypothetical protein